MATTTTASWALVAAAALALAALVAWRWGGERFTGPTPSAMVIVEPRRHPHLQRVLENFHRIMPSHYDLYVFHGASAGEFARQAAANVARERRTHLVALDADNLGADEYNALLKDPERFWARIDAENVLVFQTDAVLCAGSDFRISDFEHLGYIGCAFGTEAGRGTHWGDAAYWGTGGLSFRKKSAALRCLAGLPHPREYPEDVFYAECVEAGFGARPRDGAQVAQFCSQGQMSQRSFGGHRVKDGMQDAAQLARFVDYCPEVKPLL